MVITKDIFSHMLLRVCDLFEENSLYLCKLDSKFGDGDHGITINKIAFTMRNKVNKWKEEPESICSFLEDLSGEIMFIGGGAASSLYGVFFEGLATPLRDTKEIDASMLKDMLNSCKEAMLNVTCARLCDKTMMDALIPAVDDAMKASCDIVAILNAAESAAINGASLTKNYAAKYGRSKNYKEKSIGTKDPGAVSVSLLFKGLKEGFERGGYFNEKIY